jgi:ankyrin repeat protein
MRMFVCPLSVATIRLGRSIDRSTLAFITTFVALVVTVRAGPRSPGTSTGRRGLRRSRKMNVPPGGNEKEGEEEEAKEARQEDMEKELNEAERVLVAALQRRRPPEEIRGIVEALVVPHQSSNAFLARKDRGPTGMTPLHYVVISGSQLRVLQYLVVTSPASVRVKTTAGAFLPLHLAVAAARDSRVVATSGGSPKAVRALVEAWPEALLEAASDGSLPLHVALRCDNNEKDAAVVEEDDKEDDVPTRRTSAAPLDFFTVRLMVQRAPHSLRVPGPDGRLPIHSLLAGWEARGAEVLKAIHLVVDGYVEALRVRDGSGHLPVHLVSDGGGGRYWREAAHILRFLVAKCPESAQEPAREARNGGALLHLALAHWRWALVTDIQHIVRCCPGIASIPDNHRNLPVHVAARRFRCKVVELLVEHRPDSVRIRGYKGRLPIHQVADPAANGRLAWDADRCLEMLRFLERRRPDSLLEVDDDGKTPLHLAAGGRPLHTGGGTLAVVRGLVEMFPDALGVTDHGGRFPLNAALGARNEREEDDDDVATMRPVELLDEVASVVRFLVERYPQALRVADPEGNLPLHVAARRGMPLPVVRLLLGREPWALHAKNHAGWLPVHLALRLDRPDDDDERGDGSSSSERWRARTVDLATVCFWVTPRPASLAERGPDGRTMVHRALRRATTTTTSTELSGPPPPPPVAAWKLAVLWHLQHACPEAALVRDPDGLLPLHLAASASADDLSLLHMVLRANPGALFLPVGGGVTEPPPSPSPSSLSSSPSSLTRRSGAPSPKRARVDGAQG